MEGRICEGTVFLNAFVQGSDLYVGNYFRFEISWSIGFASMTFQGGQTPGESNIEDLDSVLYFIGRAWDNMSLRGRSFATSRVLPPEPYPENASLRTILGILPKNSTLVILPRSSGSCFSSLSSSKDALLTVCSWHGALRNVQLQIEDFLSIRILF